MSDGNLVQPVMEVAGGSAGHCGVAEGARRQVVKDRMELTGMRWTLPGAQSMLHLRVVYLNGDWDDYLDFYIQAEQAGLYTMAAA